VIRDELNAAGEAVRALARQRQAAGYLARLQVTVGTDQMPLPPSLEADLTRWPSGARSGLGGSRTRTPRSCWPRYRQPSPRMPYRLQNRPPSIRPLGYSGAALRGPLRHPASRQHPRLGAGWGCSCRRLLAEDDGRSATRLGTRRTQGAQTPPPGTGCRNHSVERTGRT